MGVKMPLTPALSHEGRWGILGTFSPVKTYTLSVHSRVLKNYLRCNYCVKNSLKMLIYWM